MRRNRHLLPARSTKTICTCCITAALALGIGCSALIIAKENPFVERAYASSISATSEASSQTFAVDGCTYLITSDSSSATPTVSLLAVDSSAKGALVIPSTVYSEANACSYTVTSVYFSSFDKCTEVTSIELPSTLSNYILTRYDSCFRNCTALEEIIVDDGCKILASEYGVLYALDDAGQYVSILGYPQAKKDQSYTAPNTIRSVVGYAFAGNTYLNSITFTAGLTGSSTEYNALKSTESRASAYIGGIGAYAFCGCKNVTAIEFPQDCTICTLSNGILAAIRTCAFKDCSSLETLRLPAITSTEVKSNFYYSFSELNPTSTVEHSIETQEFTSGYMPYWHNNFGPVYRSGMDSYVFAGCTKLKTIVFEGDGNLGAMCYWTGSGRVFGGVTTSSGEVYLGCTALESIIYEGKQAYFGNPNGSMQNSTLTDIWVDSDDNTFADPDYYYAVDYYATQQDAETDNSSADNRLSRVEYKRGTSTAAIATSDSSLSDCTVDKQLYAKNDKDGTIPDPNEAAKAAGLGEGNWVWKLSDTQSKRDGITESCYAYLVNENDISAGRLDANQITALYKQCDRNLSQGIIDDTLFDPQRYATEAKYIVDPFSGETSPWFKYDLSSHALMQSYTVVAANGTILSSNQYEVSYQTYNSETKELESANLGDKSGAYLVTIKPTEDSGYTGVLQDWILVENHSGTFVENYSDSLAEISDNIRYSHGGGVIDFSDAVYAITVGSNDVYGALMGASYAGLVGGAINVEDSDDAGYGFVLNFSTYVNGRVKDASKNVTFSRSSKDGITAAGELANQIYDAIEENRSRYGISGSEYSWGETALLINVNYADNLSSVAAYAYAEKAPVFFTEEDGSVSEATLKHLALFKNVAVVGNSTQFSEETFTTLESSLKDTSTVVRLGGKTDTVGDFSLAIAQLLVDEGKATFANVSVSDGSNPVEVIAALTSTGHLGGITLASKSTSESKKIAQYLHDNNANIEWLTLFGPSTAENATKLSSENSDVNVFDEIWSTDSSFKWAIDSVSATVDEYSDSDIHGSGKKQDSDDEKKDDESDDEKKDSDSDTDKDDDDADKKSNTDKDDSDAEESESQLVINDSKVRLKVKTSNTSASLVSDTATTGDVSSLLNSNDISSETGNGVAQSSAANEETQDTSSSDATSESAPLSSSAPFVVALAALCGSAIPILRRTK